MIERLDISEKNKYSATEASIHLTRYLTAKKFIQGKTVLDIACGEGYGSYLMKKWGAKTVQGVDIDQATIDKATDMFREEGLQYLCHTAEELPFNDYSFDVIVSFETIEHLDSADKFLHEIKRVLKPGGIVLLSCPNDYYYYENAPIDNPFHKRKYHFYEFKEFTEGILGKAAQYYLGFATDGFVTVPIEDSTLPENHSAPDTMLELFNYQILDNTAVLKQERLINYWNCNYYLGIWGSVPNVRAVSAAIYPRETFIKVEDRDIDFYRDVKKSLDSAKGEKEMEENRGEKIAQTEHDAVNIENERLKMMLDLANKEIAILYNTLPGNTAGIDMSCVSLGSNAEGDLLTQLNYYKLECARYENSTCWKITKPIRWVADLVKRNFH